MIGRRRVRRERRVLLVLLTDATNLSGWVLCKTAGVASGTLYPYLARLEKHGWAVSEWDEAEPREDGSPRRRCYRLTPAGRAWACEQLGLSVGPATPSRGGGRHAS